MSLYRISNTVALENSSTGTIVKKLDISTNLNQDLILTLDIFSEKSKFVTIFVGANDGRFLATFNKTLSLGNNIVDCWFNGSSSLKYGYSVSHPTIIVLDDTSSVIYNGDESIFDESFILIGFIAISFAMLIVFLFSVRQPNWSRRVLKLLSK